MARLLKHLTIGLLVHSAMACVLFVEDGPFSSTCTFSGREDAACGRCIAAQCQTLVDACCGEGSCHAHLPSLDACGRGDDCGALFASSPATSTALTECVSTQCKADCITKSNGGRDASTEAGRDAESSRTLCSSSDRECSCTAWDTPIPGPGVTCDASTFAGGTCCADLDFPNERASCTCYKLGCTGDGSSTGCLCGPGVDYDLTCKTQCCVSEDKTQCRCRSTGICYTGETAVADCKSVRYECGPKKKRVESCSL